MSKTLSKRELLLLEALTKRLESKLDKLIERVEATSPKGQSPGMGDKVTPESIRRMLEELQREMNKCTQNSDER